MKLSYEQLRHLASLGDSSGQLCVKNRKGQVLRPNLKQWGPKTPKEMPYTSTKEPQRPCPVPMDSHSRAGLGAEGIRWEFF